MQTAFFMESAYCKKCGKGTSVNLFCNNEILMLFLGFYFNTIFLTLLWRTIKCLHARPFPPTDDEAARAGKIHCHNGLSYHKCRAILSVFKKNSLNKSVDKYELLRIAIYNDCRVVPLCGTDDDNRAAYFATFIQQEQERGV